MRTMRLGQFRWMAAFMAVLFFLEFTLMLPVRPALAALGGTVTTIAQPTELPVEIEVELGPASLKQAPLWKETIQLLRDPYLAPATGPGFGPSAVVRRPAFRQPGDPRGPNLPALNVWPLNYNFLTSQPLRLRTSDGEISWDQPGPLFHPNGSTAGPVTVDEFNVPIELMEVIGHIVACPDTPPGYQAATLPVDFCTDKPDGSLVVHNTTGSLAIPPDGTVVAVSAVLDGVLQELEGVSTDLTVDVEELEIPINEEDFIADRAIAEVLGKALFWDMQVGSDGVQACGTCHFHAGVDNRTRNQLNPNHLGGDLNLEVFANRAVPPVNPQNNNQDVVASDFPFHKRVDPDTVGDGTNPAIVVSDSNDVMSSMGISRFTQFVDIVVGAGAFGPAFMGVSPLLPDLGTPLDDPIPVMQGLRRVEPRNTPTMHSAAFNFDNFWDGRARFHFNGGSVFGQSDPTAHIFIDDGGVLAGATNGHIRPDLIAQADPKADQPVRIKFSSLASQATGPPLSNFEMSFDGRNWAKIGKKLLQAGVVPLANQLVDPTDSVLGPYSGQRSTFNGAVDRPGRPGLNISYSELIEMAFNPNFWNNTDQHLVGTAVPLDQPPPAGDPFDGYVLAIADLDPDPANTNQFTQKEANFSLFFGLAVQAYEQLLIPDDTPFDRFMDANPLMANGIGQPGEQRVLFPTLIPGLVDNGSCPAGTTRIGVLCFIPDDPATAENDGFGPEELFGLDFFMAGNLTAALPVGSTRNPAGFGSNPFTRHARCSLCHIGPEQTDHSINISHGLLKGDAEFEFPSPPLTGLTFTGADGRVIELPTTEPPGPIAHVGGLILAEEVAGTAQDVIELEPRNMAATGTLVDAIIAAHNGFAFGDQGIYNIGLRPVAEDIGRGGDDPFGWPLAMSALALKNIGGPTYEPYDDPANPGSGPMLLFDPDLGPGGGLFEETGEGLDFPEALGYTLQSINPGLDKTPIVPRMPPYMAPWLSDLPAGELHPQIDELGFIVNTTTFPNGGPAVEFGENLSATDLHCGTYDPTLFGNGPPNFGWGALDPGTGLPVEGVCSNNQSGVPGNMGLANTAGTNNAPLHGTWGAPNRVGRRGAFKAPQLRNVELTGPYFHTGSYLTLRQVVDFYMRAGDFPLSNAEGRDQHIVNIGVQAFGFGTTRSVSNGGTIPDVPFADALPDTDFQFDPMPDTNHNFTPEYVTQEEVKVALVKFLLSLTDPRVRYERAPFDRPQIFVPIDGTAPENTGGPV